MSTSWPSPVLAASRRLPATLLAAAGLLTGTAAQQLIYDNGPLSSHASGGGPLGTSPRSVLAAPHTVLGFGAQNVGPNRLVEEFVVASYVLIEAIEVFGYATGVQAPNCTGIWLSVWDQHPSLGGNQLLAGGGPQNNLIGSATNTLTGVYRVSAAAPQNTDRPIQSVRVDLPTPLLLATGTWWLEWSFTGPAFTPPLVTTDVLVTGNATQFTISSGAYAPIQSGTYRQGLPFRLYGVSGNEIGAILDRGGGCSAATMSVEGAPNVGGYARSRITNLNPMLAPLTVLGIADPDAALPGCTCRLRASLDVLAFGDAYEVQVPMNPQLLGAALFFQGALLGLVPGSAPCDIGVPFELTNGCEFSLGGGGYELRDLVVFDETEIYDELLPAAPGQPIKVRVFDLGPYDQPHTVTWSTTSPNVTVTPAVSTMNFGDITEHILELHLNGVAQPEQLEIVGNVQPAGGGQGPLHGQVRKAATVKPFPSPGDCVVRQTTSRHWTQNVVKNLTPTNAVLRPRNLRRSIQIVAQTGPGSIRVQQVIIGFPHMHPLAVHVTTDYTCSTGCPPTMACTGTVTPEPAAGGLAAGLRLTCLCQ
jgi:hypothetical protein